MSFDSRLAMSLAYIDPIADNGPIAQASATGSASVPACMDGGPMSQQEYTPKEPVAPPHPLCPTCSVPMWLVAVGRFGSQDTHQTYECKVCDEKLVVPLPVSSPKSTG